MRAKLISAVVAQLIVGAAANDASGESWTRVQYSGATCYGPPALWYSPPAATCTPAPACCTPASGYLVPGTPFCPPGYYPPGYYEAVPQSEWVPTRAYSLPELSDRVDRLQRDIYRLERALEQLAPRGSTGGGSL